MHVNRYRLRGMALMVVGGIGTVVLANSIADSGGELPGGSSIRGNLGLGVPGALAIWGLVELAMGKSLIDLEVGWAALTWWQRLIGGVCIVLIGGIIAFTFVALVLL